MRIPRILSLPTAVDKICPDKISADDSFLFTEWIIGK